MHIKLLINTMHDVYVILCLKSTHFAQINFKILLPHYLEIKDFSKRLPLNRFF